MSETLRLALTHVPLGMAVGLIGSLLGIGGGFFVVPFLLVWRGFRPEHATAASLGIVFVNALSSTAANAARRRIDYRTGLILALATIPGAWLGRWAIGGVPERAFALSFAALVGALALYFGLSKPRDGRGLGGGDTREIVDSDGHAHRYRVHLFWGVAACLAVGFASSFFGIGGGVLLVPFLGIVFGMPILIAASTAQFVFLFASGAGFLNAIQLGQLTPAGLVAVLPIGLGVVAGAQAGVAIAKRIRPGLVRLMLSAVLLAVAALMSLSALWGRA